MKAFPLRLTAAAILLAIAAPSALAANKVRVPLNEAAIRQAAATPSGSVSVAASYDFGTSGRCSTGLYQLPVTNTGTTQVTIATITTANNLTGSGKSAYSIGGAGMTTCAGALAAGASCTVWIQGGACSPGDFNATLTIDAGIAGPKTTALHVLVQMPVITLGPNLNFGNVTVGNTSAALNGTVTNTGNAAMTGLTFSPPAGFNLSLGTCASGNLAVGASCQYSMTWTPSATGSVSATMSVTATNASNALLFLFGNGQ